MKNHALDSHPRILQLRVISHFFSSWQATLQSFTTLLMVNKQE